MSKRARRRARSNAGRAGNNVTDNVTDNVSTLVFISDDEDLTDGDWMVNAGRAPRASKRQWRTSARVPRHLDHNNWRKANA